MGTTPRKSVVCAPGVAFGGPRPVIIAGPCMAESLEVCRRVAGDLGALCADLGLPYVFKASFDKANRTSAGSPRGPGLDDGLRLLAAVREEFGVPVLTDIHLPEQARPAAAVVDILQIPAFLCRQTDLLLAAAETGKPVNIKKGQFLAPEDMRHAVHKVRGAGNPHVILTERGTTFGYHNLVVDMRSLVIMAGLGVPVVFDATHSVQLPGGLGQASGGQRQYVAPLARAAAAIGVDGLFLEVHPDPDHALSDAANSLPIEAVGPLLRLFRSIHELARES
ncbi:MAG: 3-deoxy-8-phosphooctulonate synthase [Lentisphaeria bacterium]|nr:3-deoxy-8-phosphooctulonate synthase [Lentisphaeria bacterium]